MKSISKWVIANWGMHQFHCLWWCANKADDLNSWISFFVILVMLVSNVVVRFFLLSILVFQNVILSVIISFQIFDALLYLNNYSKNLFNWVLDARFNLLMQTWFKKKCLLWNQSHPSTRNKIFIVSKTKDLALYQKFGTIGSPWEFPLFSLNHWLFY